MMFRLKSEILGSLNICAEVQAIHGFFKLHFYVKYWFLNNTEMPMKIQIEESNFKHE